MELVVDANVLLACFIRDGMTRELLLDSRLTLYAPEHLLTETSRHLRQSSSLRKRIGLSGIEISLLFELLTQNIKTIPKQSYSTFMKKALSLAPHEEDAPYLAVALHLKISIWSNDRGMKEQDEVAVYPTAEVLTALKQRF